MKFFFSFLSVFALIIASPKVQAMTISIPTSTTGIGVSINDVTGAYQVTEADPSWTFAGTVGGPVSDVRVTKGRDERGDYQELTFHWNAAGLLVGAIREYQAQPIIQFAVTSLQASAKPTPDFPAFTTFPQNLHALSYQEVAMSRPKFDLEQNGTPWILFDDAAHTAVLSADSDFLVAQMHGDGKTLLASGLNANLSGLPAGFMHRSLLVLGSGICATISAWGNSLTEESGKTRPTDNADPTIKYLGYWTDNGATYYYNYDTSKGYAGTLLALVQRYRQENVPIHYLQLDSWWYQKTQTSPGGRNEGPKNPKLPLGTWNAYGGTLEYSASPDLFPQGLAAFQKSVGLPLVVHARWIDPTSPYHKDYKISGLAPVDSRWWDSRTQYLKDSGVITYEQDWLSEIYFHSPDMSQTLETGPAFTDNMARAAWQHGQTMQYCMPLPRFFLEGSRYPNLTTIRTSDDRLDRGKWNNFLYTSLLADAVHLRPFTDVFFSTELDNLTLATLSTGPVGIGDALGSESRAILLKSVRADGVIVKPDATLLPTDATILADAQGRHLPLVAATETQNGERTEYIFAYTRPGDTDNISFTPQSMGLTGSVYVYRTSDSRGTLQNAADAFTDTLASPTWEFYVAAPVGRSGIAFLGDTNLIVGTGRQRISSVQDAPGSLTATVVFAPGEKTVMLHGYAAFAPIVSVTGGQAQPLAYQVSTGDFTVVISPNPTHHPQRINGDLVTLVTVILRHK
jgi:hypothetical protein